MGKSKKNFQDDLDHNLRQSAPAAGWPWISKRLVPVGSIPTLFRTEVFSWRKFRQIRTNSFPQLLASNVSQDDGNLAALKSIISAKKKQQIFLGLCLLLQQITISCHPRLFIVYGQRMLETWSKLSLNFSEESVPGTPCSISSIKWRIKAVVAFSKVGSPAHLPFPFKLPPM